MHLWHVPSDITALASKNASTNDPSGLALLHTAVASHTRACSPPRYITTVNLEIGLGGRAPITKVLTVAYDRRLLME